MTERIRPPCPDVSAAGGYLRDPIRNRPLPRTPEECIRQHVVSWLIKRKGWPANQIRTEYNCRSGGFGTGRIDIALIRPTTPAERKKDVGGLGIFQGVVECKRAGNSLADHVEDQAFRCRRRIGASCCYD
jgi:hypothetical protein